jgi:hypothetical protein
LKLSVHLIDIIPSLASAAFVVVSPQSQSVGVHTGAPHLDEHDVPLNANLDPGVARGILILVDPRPQESRHQGRIGIHRVTPHLVLNPFVKAVPVAVGEGRVGAKRLLLAVLEAVPIDVALGGGLG